MTRARALDPLSPSVSLNQGWRLYMAHRYYDAITELLNTIGMDPTYLVAYIVRGPRAALAWLSKSYDDRSNNTIFLKEVPQFDNLRSEPQFQNLLRRIGL